MASALRQLKRSWLQLKGRARAKIGPVATWVPLEGTAYFKFPVLDALEFHHAPGWSLALSSGEEAFDGEVCRKRHNREPIIAVERRRSKLLPPRHGYGQQAQSCSCR